MDPCGEPMSTRVNSTDHDSGNDVFQPWPWASIFSLKVLSAFMLSHELSIIDTILLIFPPPCIIKSYLETTEV